MFRWRPPRSTALRRTRAAEHLLPLLFRPRQGPCEVSAPPLHAPFSTRIVGDEPVLVRDFIRSALYDPKHGYFSQRSGSVGVLERSIKFNQLEGRKDYMEHLDKIYRQSDISWFTPVELFKPWYAHGIAEAIMRTANLSVPLKIYEIGGGSGTCAKGIMDYMKLNAPERVYNSMTYISVEISPSLAKIQRETVGKVLSHSSKFRVECRDATDRSGWGDREEQICWVIMLEVLDNLPHDLIYAENQISPWMEVWVKKQNDRATLSESYKPLEDPLIKNCLEIVKSANKQGSPSSVRLMADTLWSKIFPRPRRCWLPTGCLKLLEVVHDALPKMSLIASDFSYLPDVRIPGERAPLVSTKKDGRSSDYNSYLDAKGDADIFFPTDFWLLERIDHFCSGWLKLHEDASSKKGKMRRTITVPLVSESNLRIETLHYPSNEGWGVKCSKCIGATATVDEVTFDCEVVAVHKDNSYRLKVLDTSSFMEEFGLPSRTRTKDGYNPLLDDFKNTKFYLSVPTHNIK